MSTLRSAIAHIAPNRVAVQHANRGHSENRVFQQHPWFVHRDETDRTVADYSAGIAILAD
jgi:hypothetical protein